MPLSRLVNMNGERNRTVQLSVNYRHDVEHDSVGSMVLLHVNDTSWVVSLRIGEATIIADTAPTPVQAMRNMQDTLTGWQHLLSGILQDFLDGIELAKEGIESYES